MVGVLTWATFFFTNLSHEILHFICMILHKYLLLKTCKSPIHDGILFPAPNMELNETKEGVKCLSSLAILLYSFVFFLFLRKSNK